MCPPVQQLTLGLPVVLGVTQVRDEGDQDQDQVEDVDEGHDFPGVGLDPDVVNRFSKRFRVT